MSYLIYNKETTRIHDVRKPGRLYGTTHYKTEGQAKAGLTREVTKGRIERADYAIAETEYYKEHIEATVTRRNLMTGKEFEESINAPNCTSPASETYWST